MIIFTVIESAFLNNVSPDFSQIKINLMVFQMKLNEKITNFKRKKERELMSNRSGKSIFTSFDSKMDDYYTH